MSYIQVILLFSLNFVSNEWYNKFIRYKRRVIKTKNSQNKKTLQIVLIVLIAVLTIGIGYASISAVNLIINGSATANPNDNNFKVKFLNEDRVTPMIEGAPTNTVSVDSDTTASFTVTTLNGAGQSVTATYRVKNVSSGIGASINLNLTNSNPEYFKVTEHIVKDKLQAGEETTVTVVVEMLKTPIESAVSTNITATLETNAIEDAEASGGEEKEVVKPIPYIYTFHLYDNTYINIGDVIPTSERTYVNFPAAKAGFGHPGAVAHIVEDGKITESYVAFEKDNKVYYLRGGAGNENELVEKPIYTKNVNTLKSAFGEENCQEYSCGENRVVFNCSAGDFYARADTTGSVYASGSGWGCDVYDDGRAACSA